MNALHREIADIIEAEGPISFARYMALALGHPRHGYYTTHRPIGAAGDFVTAPEISQMFGELVGLWCAETWRLMGGPPRLDLVELGPGRGTMMADMLRVSRKVPAFAQTLAVHLVETSETQRALQRETLAGCDRPIAWHASIDTLPNGAAIIVANEFFDALPVSHYVRDGYAWRERLVGLDPSGALRFGLAGGPEPPLSNMTSVDPRTSWPGSCRPSTPSSGSLVNHQRRDVPTWMSGTDPAMATEAGAKMTGGVIELCAAARDVVGVLAEKVVATGGVMLTIDYGYLETQTGETIQAVRRHRFADPLVDPGEADLTAHVDFAALARVARERGAQIFGPIEQGEWLKRLGIVQRAAALKRGADAAGQAKIDAALARLAGPGPARGEGASMGSLFKVMAIAAPTSPPLPGFD